ncbi:ArsR/SmtB family transcription factor [Pseudonocardia hispaniensis]|uniref:ArsR/SmtB family transcription factor n=1 Tax=Pseudonocardia hispaniensis TaxID=904933 RepID=A0ABW1J762_9PSEU
MTSAPFDLALPHPRRSEMRIEAVLHALADPVRLTIVRALAQAPHGISCGAVDLPVSKSTVTHHMRILREAGVIHTQPVGTARISTLRRDDLDALYPGLLDGVLAAER